MSHKHWHFFIFMPLFAVITLPWAVWAEPGLESLPWFDDFDADGRPPGNLVDDTKLWEVAGTGLASIEPLIGTEGSQGLSLATGVEQALAVSQYLNPGFIPVVWTDFVAHLAPYAPGEGPPEVPEDATVSFYVTSTGQVQALNGDTWVTIKSGLDPAQTHRYTFSQNFSAEPGTWRVWINGELLTPTPLTFANPRKTPLYLRFAQSGDRAAAIDDVRMQRSAPAGLEGVNYYADWSALAPDGDANGNMLSNFLEYALNFDDPSLLGVLNLPKLVRGEDGTYAVFTYQRNPTADDAAYRIEKSFDLDTWQTVESTPEDVSFQDLDGLPGEEVVEVIVHHDPPDTPLFLRLQVNPES